MLPARLLCSCSSHHPEGSGDHGLHLLFQGCRRPRRHQRHRHPGPGALALHQGLGRRLRHRGGAVHPGHPLRRPAASLPVPQPRHPRHRLRGEQLRPVRRADRRRALQPQGHLLGAPGVPRALFPAHRGSRAVRGGARTARAGALSPARPGDPGAARDRAVPHRLQERDHALPAPGPGERAGDVPRVPGAGGLPGPGRQPGHAPGLPLFQKPAV